MGCKKLLLVNWNTFPLDFCDDNKADGILSTLRYSSVFWPRYK